MGSQIGARKRVARQLGIRLEEYIAELSAGRRWCSGCRRFQLAGEFSSATVQLCRDAKRVEGLTRYALNREALIAQRREHERQQFLADPEAFRQYKRETQRRRRAADPTLCARESQRWRQANLDVARARNRDAMRRARTRDPEKCRESVRRWSKSEKGRAWHRAAWPAAYQRNRERYFIAATLRRARKLNAPGAHTAADRRRLFEAQDGLCFYCGTDLALAGRDLDHKTPLVRGGSNDPENLCWACPRCNGQKHTRTAEEYLWLLGKAASP